MRQLSLNGYFLGHLEDSKIFKHTILVTLWPSFWKPRLICAIDQKKIHFFKNRPKNDIYYLNFEIFFQKKFFA